MEHGNGLGGFIALGYEGALTPPLKESFPDFRQLIAVRAIDEYRFAGAAGSLEGVSRLGDPSPDAVALSQRTAPETSTNAKSKARFPPGSAPTQNRLILSMRFPSYGWRVIASRLLEASQSCTAATGSSKSSWGRRAMTCQVNATW